MEDDNTLPIAEVTEHVMDNVQSIVSLDTCSKAETLGASSISISKAENPSGSIAEELSIESDKGVKDGHSCLSIDERALQGHGLEGSTVHDLCTIEGCKPPCEEDAIVEPRHVQNATATDTSSKAETLVASSAIDADNSSIENNGCEKDDHQHEDLLADKKALQGHGMDPSMAVCGVTEDDESSHITSKVEDDVQEHGFERNHVACGVMGDDGEEKDHEHSCFVSPSGNEEHKHSSDDLPSCEAISDQEKMSANHMETELCGNIDDSLSNDESVESHDPVFEVGRLGEDEETKSGAKNPLTDFVAEASDKVEAVREYQDSDYTCKRAHISYAESCEEGNSRLGNEDSETGDVCSPAVLLKFEAIQHEDAKYELLAVSEKETAGSSGVGNTLLSHYGKEHTYHTSISSSLLNTEDKEKCIAHVGESGDLVTRQDICEDIPEVGSMKLQDLAIDVKSGDGITNGSLEVLTCVADTVDISHLAHRESAGDEDCLLIAGQAPSMKNLPSSSSIVHVKDMDDNNLRIQCSEGNKSVGTMDFGVCQTEGDTASNESQLHGYTVDKDGGGSSVDSTAGTGWKLQGTDGCIAAEDEEASSTGGEDSASSPACLQPSTQQRKKINIHHQFVREIVRIQHDRELYDREQAERQIQAQQAATSAHLGGKSLDSKGHRSNSSDAKQLRSEGNKISAQKGLKDHGDDGRQMDAQQKHATRNKKPLLVQAKDGSSHQKVAPQESSEHVRQPSVQGRDSLGAKEHGKSGRGRQQRAMSIYRPPVVRDSLAAGELETSYRQSGTYAMNSSPDSATSSVSEPHLPIVDSPNLLDDEGTLKVARSSSSGESYAHNREPQAEQCTPGMGIKVTFDTEKKLRHIEFSDFPRGQRQSGQVNLAASHSRTSKSPIINPLLSHPSQESKSSYIDRRQAVFNEAPSKANDRYFTQADRNSSLQGSSPSESSQFQRGKIGKASDRHIDRKNSFFEHTDNSAILHNSGAWLQNSPSLARHGNNGSLSGPNIYSDNVRHAEGYAGDMRTMPSALLQGFNTPSARKASSVGPSYKGELLAGHSYKGELSSPYMRIDEPNQTPGNFPASLPPQQFNVPRSKHDLKGKQRLATSSDGNNKKRDLQLRNSIKESGSPFQAMMKDSNRQHAAMFSSPSPSSGDASLDIRGFGTSWDMEDHAHTRNHQDNFYEGGLKWTQSDAWRKGSTQNLQQAQSSPLPSRESFFSTMPMQEKWGDIVDDQYDSYDYLQGKHEEQRESHAGSLPYGGNAFVDAASLKAEKQMHMDVKQNKVLRKYGSESGSVQRNKAASELLLQDHAAYETPVRKSVFERLGPQNNFKESILGPPPKVMDTGRGVLRASPDAFISNTPPVSTFKSFDTGFHGSRQAPPPHLSSMLHDPGDNFIDEGREVVIQAYTELKQRRSKRELYVPRRGS